MKLCDVILRDIYFSCWQVVEWKFGYNWEIWRLGSDDNLIRIEWEIFNLDLMMMDIGSGYLSVDLREKWGNGNEM